MSEMFDPLCIYVFFDGAAMTTVSEIYYFSDTVRNTLSLTSFCKRELRQPFKKDFLQPDSCHHSTNFQWFGQTSWPISLSTSYLLKAENLIFITAMICLYYFSLDPSTSLFVLHHVWIKIYFLQRPCSKNLQGDFHSACYVNKMKVVVLSIACPKILIKL